ncbi:MAG TPA: RsmB/NOP family class I SAM-dependent RNA methyltransferase [Kofleriaceae bacterium]|jgi:16S rRNA (cytosine967-C5)-methyltransferase|nr:RsmB/NOP family class I SAM-dependent RNA methyltransferase [Kofleriaceae bacterium]
MTSALPDLDRIADRKLATHVVEGGRLCALVLELWQRTRMDWGFATDRLATSFRKETWIGSHERRFVSETLYGLVRHLRRIDAALARGRKTQRAPRDLERLLALLVLDGLIDPARAGAVARELDWNAVAEIDQVIARERKLVPRIALAASLPDWLAARLVADWGDEAEPLALALNRRAPMTVRANLLVGDRDALAAELARGGIATTPGRWCETALHLESRTNLFALAPFTSGAMEAQDEGSQLLGDLAAACTRASAPGLVVDLCAGAGGKTLAIAARLGNRGRIVSADVDARKLEELRRRARRAHVSSAQTVHLDAGRWPAALDALRGKADVVLVDAPCSGIGALRRNPEARWRLREADLAAFAARQQEILGGACSLLAPGGRLVYATCTLLAIENVNVASTVVGPGLVPVPITEILGDRARELGDGDAFTVTPHRHGTDGFYARVMRRVD